MAFFGLILTIIFILIVLYIAYFVIRIAVRHGIDSSELARFIRQNHHNE